MDVILNQLIAAGVPEDRALAIAEQAVSLAKAQPTDDPDMTKLAKSLGDLRDAFSAQAREEAQSVLSEDLDDLQKSLEMAEEETYDLGQLMDAVLDVVKDADSQRAEALDRIEAKQDAICKALVVVGEHVEALEDRDGSLTDQLGEVSKALNVPVRKSIGAAIDLVPHAGDQRNTTATNPAHLRAAARKACLEELSKGDMIDRTRQFVLSQAVNRLNTPGTDLNEILNGVGFNSADLA